MNRMMPMSDNAPRFPTSQSGHVESWFIRANAADAPAAFWLKATVLRSLDGSAVAEAWIALFDGDRRFAQKITVPLAEAKFTDQPDIAIAGCRFSIGASGKSTGSIGDVSWDVAWEADPILGHPMIPYFSRRLIDGGFPKSKLLTPVPVARFSGSFTWAGKRFSVDSWIGMQGHNWGKEHAFEYAWAQCIFTGADGSPFAMAEGFSGRIRIAGRPTPKFSSLVVRRGAREYRFDRIFDLWNQTARIGPHEWQASFRGKDGDAMIAMQAVPAQMVCLGYPNPDGALSYCNNSKLARVVLRVNPINDEGFECRSAHGGALELLSRTADPLLPPPV